MLLANSKVTRIKQIGQRLYLLIGASNRAHKFIQLPNGTVALLISDPKEDVSAVALSVSSGAYNDPPEVPGLAHLCEHMLLLGSREYPKPNSLQKLVSSMSDGAMNAFTTGETTCFYYQMRCPNNDFRNLDESLKILGDISRNPEFNNTYLKKEIFVIDNEHIRNKSNLRKVLFHALRLLSSRNPNNKFNKFATGNYTTLYANTNTNKVNLQQKLFDYFELFYKPEYYKLVIKSPQSINILQKMVLASFDNGDVNDIKRRSSRRLSFETFGEPITERPFGLDELNKCILVTPGFNGGKKETNPGILRLVFPIDYISADDKVSRQRLLFIETVAGILGDGVPGSLFQHLKAKNLADGLACFISDIIHGHSCLILEIELTRIGRKKISQIISTLFSLMNENFTHSEHTEEGSNLIVSQAKFLSNLASISLLNYLYLDTNTSPMDEVSDYAINMQQNQNIIGKDWVLRGSPSWSSLDGFRGFYDESVEYEEWWKTVAMEFRNFIVKFINLNNMSLLLYGEANLVKENGKLFYDDDHYYRYNDLKFFREKVQDGFYRDENFEFLYKYFSIDVNYLAKQIEGGDFARRNSSDFLLSENVFLPDFAKTYQALSKRFNECYNSSIDVSLGFNNNKSAFASTPPFPIKIEPLSQVWLKQDSLPKYHGKSIISMDMVNAEFYPTASQIVSNEILIEIIAARLSPKLFSSEILGFSWNLTTSSKNDLRIGIIVSGFNSKIKKILEIIFNEFQQLKKNFRESVSDEEYYQARIRIRKFYKLLCDQNSLELATFGTIVLLEENSFELSERLGQLEDNTYEDVELLLHGFFNRTLDTNVFAQGDSSKKSVLLASTMLRSFIKRGYGEFENGNALIKNRIVLPGTIYIEPGNNFYCEIGSFDFTSSIVYFVQTGSRNDLYIRTMTKLLNFFVSADISNELRTVKQLGYVVLSGERIYRSTVGIHISIVSGNFSPKMLEDQINWYLNKIETELHNMTEKEFNEKVRYAFLKTFINNEHEVGTDTGNDEKFFESLNEQNLKSYLNAFSEATGDTELDNLSLVSMYKTGSNLENLNTELGSSHLKLWDEIISKTYRFTPVKVNYKKDKKQEFSEIDLMIIKNLTKNDFEKFFAEKISIKSSRLSKLSIWVNSRTKSSDDELSSTDNEEVTEVIVSQIQMLLQVNNLLISKAKLVEIVKDNNNSQPLIIKALLKYFMKNGERIKVISTVLKGIVQALNMNLKAIKGVSKSRRSSITLQEYEPQVPLTRIEAVSDFHLKFTAL